MTVKQEQRLIAELGKVITALGKAQDLANKLGAIGTSSDIQCHALPIIKGNIDFHAWHMGEVTKGNLND